MRTFDHRHRYDGKLKAVLFDWAGTIVDYGSCAPAAVFIEVFRDRGVEITIAEAREPMGKAKRDHIESLLAMPRIARAWQERHDRATRDGDIDALYAEFLPRQLACLAEHSVLIPGVLPVIDACRRRGMKIGSSTGYVRELMDVVLREARRQRLEVDAMVCASDVSQGRPAPWMCLENARRLDVSPMAAIVAVDDTPVGIEAGVSAGMWTVGVALSGNEMGLTPAAIERLSPVEREQRLERATARLAEAGAHFVIGSVADLLPVLDAIEQRLAAGERP
ncbi:MAG TPA: phosphonoacetaldehyde hydrolase [Pirellulales bacterium]|jgi:phosphonoacetaldehyde hydrolase|nr:phosphonoacetaldehyde hydrolase [Pirellulales bacterium]